MFYVNIILHYANFIIYYVNVILYFVNVALHSLVFLIISSAINQFLQFPLLEVLWVKNKAEYSATPVACGGGQGPYLRSLDHLVRSSEAKDRKKCDGGTDGPSRVA